MGKANYVKNSGKFRTEVVRVVRVPKKTEQETPEPSEIMTLSETAAWLRVDEATVSSAANDGTLPGRRIGSEWRFSKPALLSCLAQPAKRSSMDGATLAKHIREVAARTGYQETDEEVEQFLAELRAEGEPQLPGAK